MEYQVRECPNNLLFAVDFFNSEKCLHCKLAMYCELTREKYRIKDREEKISLSKARDFIQDVWGKTWSYPIIIKRNAEKYNLLSQKKGKKFTNWTISYTNIFILMNTPLWKTLYAGRLHGESS
jgi:hypothetical protein